jgi:glutamate/tyrosine decarboxylase-like PLP-dependent enzyme
MDMAGLGGDNLREIAIDGLHRIDLDALKAAIVADREAGLRPFLLVANAGTVDAGGIDDIDALADIAGSEGLHLHVDGAYGALGMLTPEIAPRLKGIERADSLAFDFHKWAHVPYDAGFILVRDGALHRDTFAAPAAYLARETRGLAGGDIWPCDYGPDLSRGFRALKVWFTLKVTGCDAIARAIEQNCALARQLQQRVEAEPELELLAPAQLSIVCFRYRAPDAVNRAIVADLQEAGEVAPSTTTIDAKAAIRAALFNHRTEIGDIDTLIEQTLTFGRIATETAA